MVRILGLDPGLGTMGFGCVEVAESPASESGVDPWGIEGPLQLVDCGIISTPGKTPVTERLKILHEDLASLLVQYQPDWVGIEKLFFYRMGNTILVAQARGVILLALAQQGLEPHEYTPAQVKQTLTGHGNASKRAVQEAVRRDLGLASIPRPDDAADGLAIALTVWHHRFEWQERARLASAPL